MPQYDQMNRGAADIKRLNENRQGSLLDFIEDFESLPGYVDDYETLLTDNRIWKAATWWILLASFRRACAQPGFYRADVARVGRCPGICAKNNPTRVYERIDFDIPVGTNGDSMTLIWFACRNCAKIEPHHQAVRGLVAQRTLAPLSATTTKLRRLRGQ